jgi:hypothetical protein
LESEEMIKVEIRREVELHTGASVMDRHCWLMDTAGTALSTLLTLLTLSRAFLALFLAPTSYNNMTQTHTGWIAFNNKENVPSLFSGASVSFLPTPPLELGSSHA